MSSKTIQILFFWKYYQIRYFATDLTLGNYSLNNFHGYICTCNQTAKLFQINSQTMLNYVDTDVWKLSALPNFKTLLLMSAYLLSFFVRPHRARCQSFVIYWISYTALFDIMWWQVVPHGVQDMCKIYCGRGIAKKFNMGEVCRTNRHQYRISPLSLSILYSVVVNF